MSKSIVYGDVQAEGQADIIIWSPICSIPQKRAGQKSSLLYARRARQRKQRVVLEGFKPRPDTPPDRTVRSILNSYFKMRNLRPLRHRPQPRSGDPV